MKVILSGGGTGGHISPALTIADQIKKLANAAQRIKAQAALKARHLNELQGIAIAGNNVLF